MDWQVVFILIQLHAPDGREIDVSADEITAVHCKIPGVENRNFADGVNAIISTTDGKNISVRETCTEVRALLKDAKG